MGSIVTSPRTTIATAVAPGGTVAIPYPTGSNQASLTGSTGGSVNLNDGDSFPQAASGAGTVAFAFGASTITITNNSGITWAVGDFIRAGFGLLPHNGSYNLVIGTAFDTAKAGNL